MILDLSKLQISEKNLPKIQKEISFYDDLYRNCDDDNDDREEEALKYPLWNDEIYYSFRKQILDSSSEILSSQPTTPSKEILTNKLPNGEFSKLHKEISNFVLLVSPRKDEIELRRAIGCQLCQFILNIWSGIQSVISSHI
jgi:hypothetical protein